MSLKKRMKMLLRSRSFDFVKNLAIPGKTGRYEYRGHPVFYRTASSDMTLMHDILFYPGRKAEYWIPREVDPAVILDFGGNIGIAALYLANRFPGARVHCCEPLPENFKLLADNTAPYDRIKAYPTALGRDDGRMVIQASVQATNYGGASLYGVEVDPESGVEVTVQSPATFLREAGVDRVDLIKIDTEGAEYDILTAMDRDILFDVKWIIGELHGVNDFKLLDYLSEAFLIDVRKTLHKRFFRFNACNRKIADRIPRDKVKWLQY